MSIQRVLNVGLVLSVLALVLATAVVTGVVPPPVAFTGDPDHYDHAELTIATNCNHTLGDLDVRIADTYRKKYVGLSDTPHLANGSGMLFTYDGSSEHTYVMREMDYPLDIVFIGSDNRINSIQGAPAPGPNQDGDSIRRTGTGKYVLEVPRGWMHRHGIHAGQRVTIDRSG